MIVIQIIVFIIALILILYYIRQISVSTLLYILLIFAMFGVTQLAPVIAPVFNLTNIEFSYLIVSFIVITGICYAIQTTRRSYVIEEHHQSLQDIEIYMLSGLGYKGVVNSILKRLAHTLNINTVAILLMENPSSKNCTVFAYGIESKFQHFLEIEAKALVNCVINTSTSIVTSSIRNGNSDEFVKKLSTQGYESFLGIPIYQKGGTVTGVLTLFNQKSRIYTKYDCSFVRTVSNKIGLVLDRTFLIDRIKEMNFESVRALVSAIESRDPYTRGHSVQVSKLALDVACEMEFSPRELTLLEYAGLLHDVGKIAVPERILRKESSLTNEEWQVMREHPIISARIIEPIRNLRSIQSWILYHHERYDGNGYPEKIKGKSIPLASRIMSVCDTYSAMVSDRPYRQALEHTTALQELNTVAGTQLDPSVVKIFTRLYEQTP